MQLSSVVESTTTEPRLSSHRERVLLVEPCATTAGIIIEAMSEHGYSVTHAESAEKALPLLISPSWFGRAAPAEVVLLCVDELDVELRTFAEIVRLAGSPLVLFGAVEPESLCGAKTFLAKPVKMSELLATVRKSLGHVRTKAKREDPNESSFYGDLVRAIPVLS